MIHAIRDIILVRYLDLRNNTLYIQVSIFVTHITINFLQRNPNASFLRLHVIMSQRTTWPIFCALLPSLVSCFQPFLIRIIITIRVSWSQTVFRFTTKKTTPNCITLPCIQTCNQCKLDLLQGLLLALLDKWACPVVTPHEL